MDLRCVECFKRIKEPTVDDLCKECAEDWKLIEREQDEWEEFGQDY